MNAYLREEDFRVKTLQREVRALFGNARHGGNVNDAIPYLDRVLYPTSALKGPVYYF